MNPQISMYRDYFSGLLTYMPSVHLALGLFALTSMTLAAGLLSVTLFQKNARWRSLAMRFTVAATALVVAGDLLAQLAWNSSDGSSSSTSIAIRTSAPYAQTVAAIMHPGERVISADELAILNHSLAQDQLTSSALPNSLGQRATPIHNRLVPWPERAEGVFDCVWCAVCLLIALRQILGRLGVSRVSRGSERVESLKARAALRELEELYGLPQRGWRAIQLRSSERIDAPFVSGFLVHTIYVPVRALPELGGGTAELRAMLAHELAHARRCDPLMSLLAQALCAACWFQPLAWIAAVQLEVSAELAADADTLVIAGCRAPEYANLLHSIAAGRIRPLTESVAGVGMMPRRSQLAGRIEQIVRGGLSGVSLRVTRAQRLGLSFAFALLISLAAAACILRYSPSDAEATGQGKIILAPAWVASPSDLAGYTLAERNGWSIAVVQSPVLGTVLNASSGSFGQPISTQDRAYAAKLNKLQFAFTSGNGWRPTLADRAVVEQILAESPHFFYAEEMLGVWYSKNGQVNEARRWHALALHDAPRIIAGEVLLERNASDAGSPARLQPVPDFDIFCTTWTRLQWNDAPMSSSGVQCYNLVETDATGHFYMPSFAGITSYAYGTSTSTPPMNLTARLLESYSLNESGAACSDAVVSRTHVGALAPFILTPYLTLTVNGKPITAKSEAAGSSSSRPLAFTGSAANLGWTRRADANGYALSMYETIKHLDGSSESSYIDDRDIHVMRPQYVLPLSYDKPLFVSGRVYQLYITATRTITGSGYSNEAQIANCRPLYFTVPGQPAALTLTAQSLRRELSGSVGDVNIARYPGGATITLQADSFQDTSYDQFFGRALFGYPSDTVTSRQIVPVRHLSGDTYSKGRSIYTIRMSGAQPKRVMPPAAA